jgi:hypothetical protein
VSEFIEECRREWKRLGVPDAAANEMAADLTADLALIATIGAVLVIPTSSYGPRRLDLPTPTDPAAAPGAVWIAAAPVRRPPPGSRSALRTRATRASTLT